MRYPIALTLFQLAKTGVLMSTRTPTGSGVFIWDYIVEKYHNSFFIRTISDKNKRYHKGGIIHMDPAEDDLNDENKQGAMIAKRLLRLLLIHNTYQEWELKKRILDSLKKKEID